MENLNDILIKLQEYNKQFDTPDAKKNPLIKSEEILAITKQVIDAPEKFNPEINAEVSKIILRLDEKNLKAAKEKIDKTIKP